MCSEVLALCVCLSVTARSFQPATNGNVQNYFGINLVDFRKSLKLKSYGEKKPIRKLVIAHYEQFPRTSGPTKHRNYLKHTQSVESRFRR